MHDRRSLLLLAALALSIATLGACSKNSPTEPTLAFDSAAKSVADSSSLAGGDKRHGDDDGSADDNGDDRRGRGGDDGTADDNDNNRRNRGRGGRGDRPNDPNDPQQPRPPRAGQEFEATVASVSGNTITLVTGTRVVVNAQTQWSARGDLRTLAALASAVAGSRNPRVEGRGTRQADGSILATTIKAEIDG
jgi:hypothetical protein